MEISVKALKFVCPACGGSECVSMATSLGQALELPVVCSGCGASAKLKGAVPYFAVIVALVVVLFWFFPKVVLLLAAGSAMANEVIGYAVAGSMALVIGAVHKYLSPRMLKWQLGLSTKGPDETSFARGVRNNWAYLVPPALFGPVIFASGGFRALPHPVIALLFFASLIPAFFPVMSGRAPFGFWGVAMAIWFAGAALALIYS